jgi:hypothetical protein
MNRLDVEARGSISHNISAPADQIDLTNIIKLVGRHPLLPYSYGCVPIVFEYDRTL